MPWKASMTTEMLRQVTLDGFFRRPGARRHTRDFKDRCCLAKGEHDLP
jgi:hypothetical protein